MRYNNIYSWKKITISQINRGNSLCLKNKSFFHYNFISKRTAILINIKKYSLSVETLSKETDGVKPFNTIITLLC